MADGPGMAHSADGELEALADTLWTERHLVELLLYRLSVAKHVLAADDRRFVALAVGEVETAIDRLRDAELQREEAIAALARRWDAAPDALTLAEIAEGCDEPLATVFADHRDGFRQLADEIEATAAENRRLASAGLQSVRNALDVLTHDRSGTYTPSGVTDAAGVAPTRLDRSV